MSTDSTPLVWQHTISTDDPEISAIEVILASLGTLDTSTQRRVLNYVGDRIEDETKRGAR